MRPKVKFRGKSVKGINSHFLVHISPVFRPIFNNPMTMFSKINESTMETECLSSTSNSAKISPSAHPSNIPVPKGWKSSDQRTANLEAGLKSLGDLAKQMTSFSLGKRLIQELEKEGIGTREIESAAVKRKTQREDKKGNKARKDNNLIAMCPAQELRDQSHVDDLMKIRRLETKADWEESRDRFRSMRSDLKAMTRNKTESNYLDSRL